MRQSQKDRAELMEANRHLCDLAHLDAVQKVMRTYGAGPFMFSASGKLIEDIEAMAKLFGISQREAVPLMIRYLNGQQPELQPSERSAPVGGSAD